MSTSTTSSALPAGYSPLPTKSTTAPVKDAIGQQKELFLKLLVAQLKNQDPTSPMDQKDMMAQMAQMSSVEQLTNLASTMTQMQQQSTFTQSVSLIGKTIDYLQGDTVVTGGTVTAVSASKGVASLVLSDGTKVSPVDVVRVA